MPIVGPKVHVRSAQLEWLRDQSARWRADGLIDEGVRAGILEGYEADSPQRRGMLVMVIAGILICTVGLLLLIGYNWALMTPTAKVGLMLAAVAGAFGASALAYRGGRATVGEALAAAGTLIFVNAIWLIAQVLHMQGHFPDAFLWAAIGALPCAYLIRSVGIGIAAAALVLVWSLVDGEATPGTNYVFLLVWPATIWLARRLDSQAMLGVAALAAAVWVGVFDHGPLDGPVLAASIVLVGSALYALGSWEPPNSRMRDAWRTSGWLVLLAVLVPLMVVQAQEELLRQRGWPPVEALVVAAGLALVGLSGFLRARSAADWAVAGTAVAAVAWAAAYGLGLRSGIAGAVLFSLIALTLCVALVRTALATDRLSHLVFGVLFALAFLIVRWVSVVENMLWSGALLLAAGGGLLVIAKLWRARDEEAFQTGGVP